MRTTVTLDEDIAAKLKTLCRERRISFKEAINSTLRAGFGQGRKPKPFRQKTYDLRVRPGVDLDQALELVAALEDEEILRKLELRK